MPITRSMIEDWLAFGEEQRGVEFKPSAPRIEVAVFAKVARAMMAMANKRDGGVVLIGIKETSTGPIVDGMSRAEAETWRQEFLGPQLAAYSDPRIEFLVELVDFGGSFVAGIQVAEFSDVPILCRKNCEVPRPGPRRVVETVLRDGAVYVRTHVKAESAEVPSHAEMRELLELAADKQIARFLRRAEAHGLRRSGPSDDDRFEAELAGIK